MRPAALLLALAAALPAGLPSAQQAQNAVLPPDAPVAMAANGARVVMPAIEALDCPTMELVLRRLDLSGYRGIAPLPPDHPDRAIFDYENRLAAAYYFNCLAPAFREADPAEAFADGFEQRR